MKLAKKGLDFLSLVLGAALLASCSPDVEDTTANYAEKEREVTSTTSATSHSVKTGSVSVGTSSITQASADTEITVKIVSYAKLDYESVGKALNFYTLEDNSVNKYYYPVRKTQLPKTLIHTDEPSSYYGTTTLLYKVDTSSVTTKKIAVLVDATLLKDKSGNAVLNLDNDDKAGEETDSYIRYLTVSNKSDGTTATDSLNAYYRFDEEDFRPSYLSASISNTSLIDSDGYATGKLRFAVDAPVKSFTQDTSKTYFSATYNYDDGLSGTFAEIYTLQTKALGGDWVTKTLSFSYHAEDDATNGYSEHTYTADTDALPYGTEWRLVQKNITGGSVPSWYGEVYGHAGYFFYSGSKEYTEIAKETTYPYPEIAGTSYVYTQSPSYIYVYGTTETTGDFTATKYTETSAKSTQQDLLSVSSSSSSWTVTPNATLSAAEDFIVTDANNTKVDSTVKVTKDESGTITKIKVTLKNENLAGAFTLWVGSGTKLTSNPAYPTQLLFGVPEDSSKGDVSGYVALDTADFEGTPIYTSKVDSSSSSDITKYVVTYVNSQDYTDYYYTLEAGSYYYIQLTNGYNSNRTYLTANGYTPACYYGSVTVTSADESSTKVSETYDDSSSSFYVSSTGVYKVRVRSRWSGSVGSVYPYLTNVNYYDGYVGFHIYKY